MPHATRHASHTLHVTTVFTVSITVTTAQSHSVRVPVTVRDRAVHPQLHNVQQTHREASSDSVRCMIGTP